MARAVTLVRHGQTERSALSAYSGRLDVALTDTGREQALEVGRGHGPVVPEVDDEGRGRREPALP